MFGERAYIHLISEDIIHTQLRIELFYSFENADKKEIDFGSMVIEGFYIWNNLSRKELGLC